MVVGTGSTGPTAGLDGAIGAEICVGTPRDPGGSGVGDRVSENTSKSATIPSPTDAHPVPSEGTRLLMTMMIMPAMKAAMEPTDKSMPPEVITNVAPMAMMPMN